VAIAVSHTVHPLVVFRNSYRALAMPLASSVLIVRYYHSEGSFNSVRREFKRTANNKQTTNADRTRWKTIAGAFCFSK